MNRAEDGGRITEGLTLAWLTAALPYTSIDNTQTIRDWEAKVLQNYEHHVEQGVIKGGQSKTA